MSRRPLLGALVAGMVLPLAACSDGCRPASGPSVRVQAPPQTPAVWALVLEVQDSGVRVVSTTPSRGNAESESIEDHLAALRSRDRFWIEYVVRAASGDRILQTGGFPISLDAIVESPRGEAAGAAVRLPRRVVTVSIPYVAEPASIVFSRVEPSSAPDVARWPRVPVGKAELRGGAR